MNVNKAIIVGNLTRSPEVRYAKNGMNVTTFGVATNRAWRNETGEPQEEVDYHNIVAFGDLAQNAAEYLVKGQQVYVEGRIQTCAWGESDGRKLIFHIFGALAEFERDIIKERTNAGLTAARARGRKGGRPRSPLSDEKKLHLARQMYENRSLAVRDICKTLGIPRSTFYKYVRKQERK